LVISNHIPYWIILALIKRMVQVSCRLGKVMARALRQDDEAVSPVIATVLLLAITVMLSSMVFVMMQGALTTTEKSPPLAQVSVRGLDNGFHVVKISSLDQSIDPAKLKYDIYPEGGQGGDPVRGYVADSGVYGVVGANVSFHDRDAGYSVTKGDYFVIDSTAIGSNLGTWRFKLIDESAGVVLVDIVLPAIEN
jgi:flagellin-like protein